MVKNEALAFLMILVWCQLYIKKWFLRFRKLYERGLKNIFHVFLVQLLRMYDLLFTHSSLQMTCRFIAEPTVAKFVVPDCAGVNYITQSGTMNLATVFLRNAVQDLTVLLFILTLSAKLTTYFRKRPFFRFLHLYVKQCSFAFIIDFRLKIRIFTFLLLNKPFYSDLSWMSRFSHPLRNAKIV
jgi:ABC-type enterochelin transport system permease subunit